MKLKVFVSSILIAIGLSFVVSCTPVSTPPAPDMAGGAYIQSGYEFFRWSPSACVCHILDGPDQPVHPVVQDSFQQIDMVLEVMVETTLGDT